MLTSEDVVSARVAPKPRANRKKSTKRAVSRRQPWLSRDGTQIWSSQRVYLYRKIYSQNFETLMGFIIFSNLVVIIHETNLGARCYPKYKENHKDCPTETRKTA